MPLTDDLCPLGFAPHSVRPTRCKRCFRDYNDHKPKKEVSKGKEADSKTSLADRRRESRDEFPFESDVDTKKPATTKLTNSIADSDDSKVDKAEALATTSSASTSTANSNSVVRRRRDRGNSIEEPETAETGARSRNRLRPHSIASPEDLNAGTERARSPSPNGDVARRSSTSGESNEDRERRRSRRIQILSAYEVTPEVPPGENSDELTSPDVAFILQVKTSTSRFKDGDEEDTISMAPTDTTETTLTFGDTLEDLQSQIQNLKSQLEVSEEKNAKLEKQTKELQESKYREVDREALERTASELLKLRAKVNELETRNQDLKEENTVMKLEVKELQDDLDKRPNPEEVERTVEELRNKLVLTESLYEELMDENEDFKREIRDLEDEIEELQDNFREDQADEYSILRKELEQTAKNCRILQFKLRKAEKRCDQLDVDKTQYEDKLKELIKAGHLDVNQAEKLNQMEQELSTARETSNRMHSEMEILQNKLKQLQEEKDILSKKKAADGSTTPVASRVSSPVTRVQSPDAKTPSTSPVARVQSPDARVPSPIGRVPSPVARREKDGRGKDVSMELDPTQLLRDLYDTMERENDLKEQLRFTEEEAENFRKKMSFLEQENETLALQIKKMASSAKRGKDRPSSREGNYDDDSGISDDTEELSHSELKLHLELNEQETSVLRRKVEELEVENISLQKEVRELQEKIEEKPKTVFELPTHPPSDPAQANIFYEQKVKVLENEAKELRMKLIDKDRENERLSSELMFKQRKGSKTVMTRSRSLDSDVQIDLKRQLQLVEQEAAILRQKMIELENENDSLSAENKALQLKANKKGPLTPQEKLQAENMHLQSKIAKLEKKLTESLEAAANTGSSNDLATTNLLKSQLKHQEEEMNALKATLETLRTENENLNAKLKLFNSKGEVVIKKRKKIPDLAPKQEFKKAVEELEVEVNQLSSVIQEKEEKNKTLNADYEAQLKTVKKLQDEMKDSEKKLKSQLSEVEKKNEKLSKSLDEEKKKVETINKTIKQLEDENKKKSLKRDEVSKYEKKIELLQKDLDEERLRNKDPKSKSSGVESVRFEDLRKVEEEKHKLQKQLVDHQRNISELEKRIADLEQSNKDSEKIKKNLKNEIDELNSELDKEKNNLKKVDSRQTEVATAWLKERDEMKKQITDLQKKGESLEKDLEAKTKKLSETEDKLLEGAVKRDGIHTQLKQREEDLKHVKENNSKLKSKLKELEEKFVKVDKDMVELTDKWKKLDLLYKKEKEDWLFKQNEYEVEKKQESKKLERMEKEHESELKDRDEEMIRLKDKLRKMDLEIKSKGFKEEPVSGNTNLEKKVKALEDELMNEKQEYEDLTSKYEMLEEEHVVTKAKLVMEKEGVEANLNSARKEYEKLEGELQTLRDTFNLRQDTWIREKLDMQEKIKDLDEKLSRSNSLDWEYEMDKINQTLAEKNTVIEQHRREEKQLKDEIEKLRRQSDDLKSKLTDIEKSRTLSRFGTDLSPSSQKELQELKNNLMKAEIEELRTKLQQEEKVHRSEVTAVKMMTDVKVAQMQDEIQMLHIQIGKFRRERDTFKEMLEGAQRTIGDLKTDTLRRRESYIEQETEELKDKLQNMRKHVDTLQDQLDNSERANSHLKTEYITEKASWEIKLAEMQTKVNELEESTILQGGKSKIIGVKTKLELAWQKEREEQQRLLHESHRMAKELRQRVIDLENARDKERTEAKRQLEDLRKTVEADQAETQIKISELQADLLELRDAHSKMRTTNDRIKREREKMERERDDLRMKLGQSQQSQTDDITTITGLVAELERLKKLVPTILEERPLSPSKLGKAQIDAAATERAKEELKNVLNKISKATEELRRAHGVREEERVRRNLSFRRALSATDSDLEAAKPPVPVRIKKDDPLSRWQNPQRVTNYPASPPSMLITPPRLPSHSTLHRKSLSLDQSLTWEQLEQTIWKSESDAGSSSSLQEPESVHSRSHSSGGDYASLEVPQQGPSPLPRRKKRLQSSLTSLESATSSRDASVEKDSKVPPPRPPSPNVEASRSSSAAKGSKDSLAVKDRFRMFGKSKSTEIEDNLGSRHSRSSDLSGSLKPEKPRDFKTKISNIFRKPPSRTSSLDSEKDSPTTSVNSALTEKLKSLKPVRDSKQYRSTGALHTKLNSSQTASASATPEPAPYSTASLPRRFLQKFHVRSKSMDEPSYQNASSASVSTGTTVVDKTKSRIETQV